jgi:hypothetical protein
MSDAVDMSDKREAVFVDLATAMEEGKFFEVAQLMGRGTSRRLDATLTEGYTGDGAKNVTHDR